MDGFGDRRQGRSLPVLCCCYWLGSRKDLQILFRILTFNLCSAGAAGKQQRERNSSGSASTVAVGRVGFEDFMMMYGRTGTVKMILIFQCMQMKFLGWHRLVMGQPSLSAENQRKTRKQLLFLDMFDTNSDVTLSFRARKMNSMKKVKVHTQGKCFVALFRYFLEIHMRSIQVQW